MKTRIVPKFLVDLPPAIQPSAFLGFLLWQFRHKLANVCVHGITPPSAQSDLVYFCFVFTSLDEDELLDGQVRKPYTRRACA
jgi:hypothetical protein